MLHANLTQFPPTAWAHSATNMSKLGKRADAFSCAVMAVRARAEWVDINGKWVRRRDCSTYHPSK